MKSESEGRVQISRTLPERDIFTNESDCYRIVKQVNFEIKRAFQWKVTRPYLFWLHSVRCLYMTVFSWACLVKLQCKITVGKEISAVFLPQHLFIKLKNVSTPNVHRNLRIISLLLNKIIFPSNTCDHKRRILFHPTHHIIFLFK